MGRRRTQIHIGKILKEKGLNGTRMNTDERGFILAKGLKTKAKIANGTQTNAGTGKGNNGRMVKK
jgi:hypothetical protein